MKVDKNRSSEISFEELTNVGGEESCDYEIDQANAHKILVMLSRGIYSDPLSSLIREYVSNAIDAHIEVDKEDVPVEFIFREASPLSRNKPTITIRDYGPGLSPDRIRDVFVKYASSTKDNDNSELGGFGLGSKSFFSYRPEFFIRTVYEGVEYTYMNSLEDGVGKLSLINKRNIGTNNPNLTEIYGIIKEEDLNKKILYDENFPYTNNLEKSIFEQLYFVKNIKYYGFDPKGFNLYQEESNLFSNKYGSFVNYKRTGGSHVFTLVLGQIPYVLPQGVHIKNELSDNYTLSNLYEAFSDISRNNKSIALYFDIGELNITTNREELKLDKNLINKFKERFEQYANSFIKTFDTYANKVYNSDLDNTNLIALSLIHKIIINDLPNFSRRGTFIQTNVNHSYFSYEKDIWRFIKNLIDSNTIDDIYVDYYKIVYNVINESPSNSTIKRFFFEVLKYNEIVEKSKVYHEIRGFLNFIEKKSDDAERGNTNFFYERIFYTKDGKRAFLQTKRKNEQNNVNNLFFRDRNIFALFVKLLDNFDFNTHTFENINVLGVDEPINVSNTKWKILVNYVNVELKKLTENEVGRNLKEHYIVYDPTECYSDKLNWGNFVKRKKHSNNIECCYLSMQSSNCAAYGSEDAILHQLRKLAEEIRTNHSSYDFDDVKKQITLIGSTIEKLYSEEETTVCTDIYYNENFDINGTFRKCGHYLHTKYMHSVSNYNTETFMSKLFSRSYELIIDDENQFKKVAFNIDYNVLFEYFFDIYGAYLGNDIFTSSFVKVPLKETLTSKSFVKYKSKITKSNKNSVVRDGFVTLKVKPFSLNNDFTNEYNREIFELYWDEGEETFIAIFDKKYIKT